MTLLSDTSTLVAALTSDARLRELVHRNIFPVVAPRGASGSLPIVVYRNAGRAAPESKDGGILRAFEVRVAATTYEAALGVADVVTDALEWCPDPTVQLSAYEEAFDLDEERYVFTLLFSLY